MVFSLDLQYYSYRCNWKQFFKNCITVPAMTAFVEATAGMIRFTTPALREEASQTFMLFLLLTVGNIIQGKYLQYFVVVWSLPQPTQNSAD